MFFAPLTTLESDPSVKVPEYRPDVVSVAVPAQLAAVNVSVFMENVFPLKTMVSFEVAPLGQEDQVPWIADPHAENAPAMNTNARPLHTREQPRDIQPP